MLVNYPILNLHKMSPSLVTWNLLKSISEVSYSGTFLMVQNFAELPPNPIFVVLMFVRSCFNETTPIVNPYARSNWTRINEHYYTLYILAFELDQRDRGLTWLNYSLYRSFTHTVHDTLAQHICSLCVISFTI